MFIILMFNVYNFFISDSWTGLRYIIGVGKLLQSNITSDVRNGKRSIYTLQLETAT